MSNPLPAGFITSGDDRRRVHLRADLADSIGALGFVSGEARGESTGALTGRLSHRTYELGTRAVLWKKCRRGGLAQPVLGDRHFGVRRFLDELALTEAARQAGIRVAEILAVAIERQRAGFEVELLVTVEPGTADVAQALAELPVERRVGIVEGVAKELRRFHGSGFLHGDLNVKNILWREDSTEGAEITLIDLDPGSPRRPGSHRTALGNLLRLCRSYFKGECRGQWCMSLTEQYRFLDRYYRGDRSAVQDFWRRATRKRRAQYLKYSRWLPREHGVHG